MTSSTTTSGRYCKTAMSASPPCAAAVDRIAGFGEILREDRDEIRFVVHHENAARSSSVAHLHLIIAPAAFPS